MIITPDYIRKFRPIAENIKDERIAIYIEEAEKLDIAPAIGAELYRKFSNLGAIAIQKPGPQPLKTVQGVSDPEASKPEVTKVATVYGKVEGELPSDEYQLLNGGYYKDCDGVEHRFEGVKAALAYFAYARFVRNHPVNITPFGVVAKAGDDSTPVSSGMVGTISADAERIGREYLAASLRFWKAVHEEMGFKPARPRRHFISIGD